MYKKNDSLSEQTLRVIELERKVDAFEKFLDSCQELLDNEEELLPAEIFEKIEKEINSMYKWVE